MSNVDLLEAQKRREAGWVDASAAAFLRRIEANDAAMSPGGRSIIKGCYSALVARLERFVRETSVSRYPVATPGYAVIMALGVKQVSAIVLHTAVEFALHLGGSSASEINRRTALRCGQKISEALQHDLLFRAWREAGAHDAAVARMKEAIKTGGKQTWANRIKALEKLATIEWSREELAVIGMDLLFLLCEACPETFVTSNVRVSDKTYKLMDLTPEASERLELDTQSLAIGSTALGMMLTPPLAWRYAE